MDRDRQRFARLIDPVHDEARAFARRLCRSSAEGDDLFQEAALRALYKVGDLRDDGAFRCWLYRVIVSVHRSRARRELLWRLVPLAGTEATDTDSLADELGGAQRARVALATLSARQREAIVLHELEGFGVGEIAAIQGATPSAVKSRLVRARARLRSVYVKRFGVSAPVASALLPGGNR